MVLGTSLFLLGVLAFQHSTELPSLLWLWLVPAAVAAGIRLPWLRLPAWLACGFAATLIHAHLVLDSELPSGLEGKDLIVEGVIAAIPERFARGTRFEFQVDELAARGQRHAVPGRVRLNWYAPGPELVAGDRWRLKVRLKRPHGFSNPGGFDYEGWLYRKRIRATGYIVAGPDNRWIGESTAYPLQRLRQRLGARIATALEHGELHGIITALAIGDRQAIDAGQWEVFRRTGTGHLVAISGLHVGLVAGLLFAVVRWSWPRLGVLARRCPGPDAAAVAAFLGALLYAGLAGFSIPTRRALVMITVVMTALLLRRQRSLLMTLMTALLVVLLIDPLAVMDNGFWLSFCAVATILFGMSRRLASRGWWWRWGRLHMLVSIGLFPVLLAMFHQVPMAAPLANFIAVPWLSFFVVPPVLAGTLLLNLVPVIGEVLLSLAAWLLSLLWPMLTQLSAIETLQWIQHAPPRWAVGAALVGIALLLLPRGVPGRWLAAAWCLPALLIVPPAPADGAYQVTQLDVGQGLSVVVRTRDRVLVYDTGARFTQSFDAGSAVLLPYLRSHGITRIDTLVISHADNDHIGGAASLAGAIEVERVITSEPGRVPWWPAADCRAGQHWQWNGVRFEILHPPAAAGPGGNDASCVLKVSNPAASVLLPGDIESRGERTLMDAGRERLAAEILVAPHHGSGSSSTPEFVEAVAPLHVLISAGYRNRWNHPDPAVVARYRRSGAQVHHSARHGALTVIVPADGAVGTPRSWRRESNRYWHGQ